MDARILEQFDLFAALDRAQREIVAPLLVEERFPAAARIFAEGAEGDRMYFVLEGVVRVSKIVGDGEEALAMFRSGSSFGEMSLIDRQPRCADAVAQEDVVLLSLSGDDLMAALESDTQLAIGVLTAMIRTLTVRLRETNEQVKAMHLMSMW